MFFKKAEIGGLTNDELACTYAALILVDDDIPVTSQKIASLLTAANVNVESIWPSLYAKALTGVNVKQFIIQTMIGGTASTQDTPTTSGSNASVEEAPPTKEAPPPEDEEESDDDFGLSLFD